MARKNLNLEDIAKMAGVSRSTVSRVLNNHPNVSKKARSQVMAVVDEHRFQLNTAARALASQRTHILGVVTTYLLTDVFADPFFPVLLQGIAGAANELRYGVMLSVTSSLSFDEVLQENIQNQLLDGVVITSAVTEQRHFDMLEASGKPYVIAGRPLQNMDKATYVDVENVEGARQMTAHLIELGYQRIGFIPGVAELSASLDRQSGYTAVMHEAGLSPLIGEPGDFTEQGGYQSCLKLLDEGVDAIFCASDIMALGAMRAAESLGLRIPHDVAIGGFDDVSFATVAKPPLTTIRQPIALLGDLAAKLLIQSIENGYMEPEHIVLPIELIVRASTVKAP